MKPKYPASVQSIERGLTILEELSCEVTGLRITELARRTGLPASTVHRLLSVFVKRGYVTQNKGRCSYRLDTKFLDLGFLPVYFFGDIYQVICDRFLEFMLGGMVGEVFLKIASRSFSVRIDRSQTTNGALLVPELTGSSSRICGKNYRDMGPGKCRCFDQDCSGALYQIMDVSHSWCTCIPLDPEKETNGGNRIGAGGTENLTRSELIAVLSSLQDTREDIGKVTVHGGREQGITH